MTLLREHSKREGYEGYTDLYLCWEYNGKKYAVRIRPVFAHDMDKLFAAATLVEEGEQLEKYI